MYNPGSNFYAQFTTANASGASSNTDFLPAGVLNHNGIDDFSVKVFVANIDIGRYICSGTIPLTYNFGDTVSLAMSGYVNGILQKGTNFFGALANSNITINVNSLVTGIAPGVTVSVTGNVPTVGQLLSPVTATGITATANVTGVIQAQVVGINPGLTISTTGGFINTIQNTINANIVAAVPGLTFSVTGTAPVNFFLPGTTVSVTGTPQVNIISINPGLSVSVTGNILSVSNVLNPVSVTGNIPTVGTVINPNLAVTGFAPANFLGIGSISPGVAVSVTGTLPLVTMYSGGLDNIQIDGTNLRQALTVMAAAIAGSSTIAGNNITYYGINSTTIQRINSTAISGARQVIVLALP